MKQFSDPSTTRSFIACSEGLTALVYLDKDDTLSTRHQGTKSAVYLFYKMMPMVYDFGLLYSEPTAPRLLSVLESVEEVKSDKAFRSIYISERLSPLQMSIASDSDALDILEVFKLIDVRIGSGKYWTDFCIDNMDKLTGFIEEAKSREGGEVC